MTVEIVCVGTEILLGNIVNTNAAFLAEECARLGLACYYQTVVGDNPDRLFDVLTTAMERSDIILLSGGLGPTKDDLTKETVARVLEAPLREDETARRMIEEFFAMRGRIPTENNWKQALIPEGASPIYNANGTAPGIAARKGNTAFYLMPGPPNELKPMFLNQVKPLLMAQNPGVFHSVTVKLVGIGESAAETKVADLMDAQSNPTLAPYAKTSEVHFRVTAAASTEEEAAKLAEPMLTELRNRFGDMIYTEREEVTLEQAVYEMLLERNMTLSTAESCTGGMISARITNVPGVSAVFREGFVTYANEAKQALLGVSGDTLDKYGAVSEEVAREMVAGAAERSGSDAAIAVTGIAGPDGGTKEKPVGLVYIATGVADRIVVTKNLFSGNRDKVRETVTATALVQLRGMLLDI